MVKPYIDCVLFHRLHSPRKVIFLKGESVFLSQCIDWPFNAAKMLFPITCSNRVLYLICLQPFVTPDSQNYTPGVNVIWLKILKKSSLDNAWRVLFFQSLWDGQLKACMKDDFVCTRQEKYVFFFLACWAQLGQVVRVSLLRSCPEPLLRAASEWPLRSIKAPVLGTRTQSRLGSLPDRTVSARSQFVLLLQLTSKFMAHLLNELEKWQK